MIRFHLERWDLLQLQPSRPRFYIFPKTSLEPELAFVFPFLDTHIDQQKISTARCQYPSSVGRNIETCDRLAQGGQLHLSPDAYPIKKTDVALFARNSDISRFSCGQC